MNEMPFLLEKTLQYLHPYVANKDAYEATIYNPGEIYLTYLNGTSDAVQDDQLYSSRLHVLANCLASYTGQIFSERYPSLSVTLPGYAVRAQILKSPRVNDIYFSIRLSDEKVFPIQTYFDSEDEIEAIKSLIASKQGFLISGGTATGKTTFLNALCHLMPIEDRIVLIEDTAEIKPPQKQTAHVLVSRSGSDLSGGDEGDAVNDARRMNPDRIILGEISKRNAEPFLSALNAGKSCCATVHANSAEDAIIAIAQNVSLSGGSYEESLMKAKHFIKFGFHLKRDKEQIKVELKVFS